MSWIAHRRHEADVVKGDYSEAATDWFMGNKREISFQWTGDTEEDFGLFLNGFKFVP